MIEYIIIFAVFVILTVSGYFFGLAGTKETSYEEAKGSQKTKKKPEKETKASKKPMIKTAKTQKEPETVSLASNIVKEALSNYKKPQSSKAAQKVQISSEKQVADKKSTAKPVVEHKEKKAAKDENPKIFVSKKQSDTKSKDVQNKNENVKSRSAKKQVENIQKQTDVSPTAEKQPEAVKTKVVKKQNENVNSNMVDKQSQSVKSKAVKKQANNLYTNRDVVDSSTFESNVKGQVKSKRQTKMNGDIHKNIEKAVNAEKSYSLKLDNKEKVNNEPKSSSNKKSGISSMKSNASEILTGEEEQIMIVAKQMKEAQQVLNSRKKKPKDKAAVIVPVDSNTMNKILPMIDGAQLSCVEIQILIDLLLNRQNECNAKGGEWVEMGRIDPLTQLKRQLDDAEKRLQEENESKLGLSEKISGLRGDLKSEKVNSTNLKKQLEQTSMYMKQKLQEASQASTDHLNLKIKDLNISLERNFQNQILQQKQTLQVEYDGQLQHINAIHAETEQQLQQYCHNQAEIDLQLQKSRATVTEYEQRMQPLEAAFSEVEKQCQVAIQGREEMAQTCQQYQQHIASLTEQSSQKEAAFSRQIHDLKSNLKASENSRGQALAQFSQVTGEREQLMQQIANLEGIREIFTQNQSKLQSTIQEKSELESLFNKVDNEMVNLREVVKNQMLKIEELQKENEELASQAFRPAADGQENGDSHEKENIVNNNLSALYEENISSLSNEISKLNDALDTQQNKCKEKVTSYEDEWKNMRDTIGRILPDILQVSLDDKPALVMKVEEETKKVIEKKPVVIEKVVKIPEEDGEKYQKLQAENMDLVNKVKNLEAEKTSLSGKLSEISEAPKPVDKSGQVTELTEENKTLNEKVTKYMNVLANTESLLESLQVSVEKEEKSWKEKMAEKDAEVKNLSTEKSNLLTLIDELNASATAKAEDSSEITCLKARLQKEQEQNQKLSSQLESQSQNSTVPEVVNANGSQNGIESHEANLNPEDSASLRSNSSVSEGVGSKAVSSTKNDNKKKKKRK